MPRKNIDNNSKENGDVYQKLNKGLVKEKVTNKLKNPKKRVFKSFFGLMFKFVLVLLIFGLSLGAGAAFAVWSFSSKLPDISKIHEYTPSETTEIYDVNNRLLAKLHDEENRKIVPLKDIPVYVQQAVISMEDERFYKHIGIDPKGILRAVASQFNDELVKGGASTITQQLARNLFLTPERKITRKIAEWVLAMKIERRFTKSQILELYLNQVYWGHNAYGVEAAAKTFFGKHVKDLNLAEASLIGGLLSSPEYYSPHRNFKLAKWRQELTLKNMVKNDFITQEEADKAKNKKIKLYNVRKSYKWASPYFTSYVVSILTEKYGDNLLRKGGLKIYTTMDPDLQELAENLIKTEIPKLKKTNNVGQGAIISLDPNTGFIKSIVGGTSYDDSQFNRAIQAKRQPGSSFKPFVYLTAFSKGVFTPDSTVVDQPISYPDTSGVWSPKNYDGKYRGAMKVRDALKKSINTIAVKTLDKVGVDNVIETAKILGIESYIGPNLSIALGSAEVTPIELASAYGVFATGGKRPRAITPILRIEDRNGNIIEDYSNQQLEQIFDPAAISMLNESLQDVVNAGTGYAARIPGRHIGGKTGTTSDHRDSWFVGYTPQLVTLVWVGNDNNSKMWRVTGGGFCAPIWKQYMTEALKGLPDAEFPKVTKSAKIAAKVNTSEPLEENLVEVNTEAQDISNEIISNSNDTPNTNSDKKINTQEQNNSNNVVLPPSSEKPKTASNLTPLEAVEITGEVGTSGNPIEIKLQDKKKDKGQPKKVEKEKVKEEKLEQELNNAMEDLRSVKELYNSPR